MNTPAACPGAASRVNPSRPAGICVACARYTPGAQGRAPAQHDGQRWNCAARVEREG